MAAQRSCKNEFEKYVCNAFYKILHVVAEARLSHGAEPGKRSTDSSFLLESKGIPEIDAEIHSHIRSGDMVPPNLLVFTVAVDMNADGPVPPPGVSVNNKMLPPNTRDDYGSCPRYKVLERWILRFERGAKSDIKPSFAVKHLLLLVKSVYSCLRLLPCHKTVFQLQYRNASCGLKYRLSTSLSLQQNECSIGHQNEEIHEYSFGEVETPSGRVLVKVQYSLSPADEYLVAATEVPILQVRERSLSCPTEPTDAAAWLESAVAAAIKTGGTGHPGLMSERRKNVRPPGSTKVQKSGSFQLLRAETDPTVCKKMAFEGTQLGPLTSSNDESLLGNYPEESELDDMSLLKIDLGLARDFHRSPKLVASPLLRDVGFSAPKSNATAAKMTREEGKEEIPTPLLLTPMMPNAKPMFGGSQGGQGRSPRMGQMAADSDVKGAKSPINSNRRSPSLDPPYVPPCTASPPVRIPSAHPLSHNRGIGLFSSPVNSPADKPPFAPASNSPSFSSNPLLSGSFPALFSDLKR
mmetsp:Transcript_44529/g.140485  ORF Transcript_44529/g.140485 Transcript_44529/m.140485 type:complete len:522 (+) Transcript_44529:381-1946(+)